MLFTLLYQLICLQNKLWANLSRTIVAQIFIESNVHIIKIIGVSSW